MTLVELKKLLDETGYPVTYSHFNEAQTTPFICYIVDGTQNFMADNKVHHKITDVSIELYTKKKDLVSESKIENLLDAQSIPYDSTDVYIESENLYQKNYKVRLI